jgi:hypothetical protein
MMLDALSPKEAMAEIAVSYRLKYSIRFEPPFTWQVESLLSAFLAESNIILLPLSVV